MPKIDCLDADLWEIREACILHLGGTPEYDDGDGCRAISVGMKPADQDRLKQLCELAYRAVDADALPCVGDPKDRLVRPADYVRWAVRKSEHSQAFPDVPADLRSLVPTLARAEGGDESDQTSTISTPEQARRTADKRWESHNEAKDEVSREAAKIILRQKPHRPRTNLNHAQIASALIASASDDGHHSVNKLRTVMIESGLIKPGVDQDKAVEKTVRGIVKDACESLDRRDLIVGTPQYRRPS